MIVNNIIFRISGNSSLQSLHTLSSRAESIVPRSLPLFANFLILSDILPFEYFSLWGKNYGIGLRIKSITWLHNDIKLRHRVNKVMPRCWKLNSKFITKCDIYIYIYIYIFFFFADFTLRIFLYHSWIIIEKERIYHNYPFFGLFIFFLAKYYRYVFPVSFTELSLALNIWL